MGAVMGKKLRRKKLVNKQLQGQLMLRMVLHWIGYNGVVLFLSLLACMFMYCVSVVNGDVERTMQAEIVEFFARHKPMLIAMLLLLPIIMWDMLKTTHRVAGPVFKFKSELQKFVDTGKFETVKLRDNDFLMDFQDTWNQAVERANRELGHPAVQTEQADIDRSASDDVIPPTGSSSTSVKSESTTLAP